MKSITDLNSSVNGIMVVNADILLTKISNKEAPLPI
jgi:hypothetical protein